MSIKLLKIKISPLDSKVLVPSWQRVDPGSCFSLRPGGGGLGTGASLSSQCAGRGSVLSASVAMASLGTPPSSPVSLQICLLTSFMVKFRFFLRDWGFRFGTYS